MNVIPQVVKNLEAMISHFAQNRTWKRFARQVFAIIINCGRQTITGAIAAVGREQRDWTQDYQLFSNAAWDPEACFNVLLDQVMKREKDKIITFAIDETSVRKTGIKIPNTKYIRDPRGPVFHRNIMWGQSYLHVAIRMANPDGPARTLPVRFHLLPKVVKPKKWAEAAEWEEYEEIKERNRMTVWARESIRELRATCDGLGHQDVNLRFVADGSFANATMFGGLVDRVDLLARCRNDLRLCFASDQPGRFYGREKFTPKEAKSWGTWHRGEYFWGGQFRPLRYMEEKEVYWQTGAKRRPLRLLVIWGQRYRGRGEYRDAMYLLTTDLLSDVGDLIQAYLDRWEIEVNHRDLKNNLGLGQGQVRDEDSVRRHPQLVALSYSLLLFSDLALHGHCRSGDYLPPPKWYCRRRRASIEDLRRHIRETLHGFPELLCDLGIETVLSHLALRCAA